MLNKVKIDLISGNFTAFREFYMLTKKGDRLISLLKHISCCFDDIYLPKMRAIKSMPEIINSNYLKDVRETLVHKALTVKFITNRGVTHELVRHRPASYAQESTRYCNYSTKKYGKQISVIEPYWWESGSFFSKFMWKAANKVSEIAYMFLNKKHAAQAARGVLPIDVKTEIVITATYEEWKNIFKLRCSPKAHPDIRAHMHRVKKYISTIESKSVFKLIDNIEDTDEN